MLQKRLKEELNNAIREKDEVKREVVRSILSGITNELVSQKRKPSEGLNDDGILSVIEKEAKQRKDSIAQYEKGGRPELAENEEKELKILETYLPAKLSRDKVEVIVRKKMKELSINEVSQVGALMGAVMKEFKGKVDGTVVKEVALSLLK